MDSFKNCYSGKSILITGHTGFKGSWLTTWLSHLGANISGLSVDVPSTPSNYNASNIGALVNDFRVDVRNKDDIKKVVDEVKPDYVFHLAAQALVRPSYESPLDTMMTNAFGSAAVLDALRGLDKSVVAVMITSDKAYDNVEWVWGYRETDRLGGKDPYSASKGMAELAIRSYVESFFNSSNSNVKIGIARAGNVIGGGDWATDRIVPDCMSAWSREEVVDIRKPDATRPWQHVLEPLSGYLSLGVALTHSHHNHGEAYNFGPPARQNYSVRTLIDEMAKHWDNVRWNDISQQGEHLHEAGLLKLNCDKALHDLDWQPTLLFEETVRMTVEWYKAFYQGEVKSMLEPTLEQIKEYIRLAENRQLAWTRTG